ncbi:MAG: sigma 54-interacting transcriptional regulator [Desulfobacteraceae bacterium]
MTRKERIVGAIHHNRPGPRNPLVGIKRAAIPETLLQSAVFGQENGAFTGAELPLDPVEKATTLQTLAAVGDNKSEAPRRLGIGRKTFRKRKQHGVMA